jgi:hypothetical protein
MCLLSKTLTPEHFFKAKVVLLVIAKDTERAIELLSQHYRIAEPKLTVGMPKRYSKKAACYVAKKQTIHVSRRKVLYNPHVILHEFYHHLRNVTSTQKGLEKHADKFAADYLETYWRVARRRRETPREADASGTHSANFDQRVH